MEIYIYKRYNPNCLKMYPGLMVMLVTCCCFQFVCVLGKLLLSFLVTAPKKKKKAVGWVDSGGLSLCKMRNHEFQMRYCYLEDLT